MNALKLISLLLDYPGEDLHTWLAENAGQQSTLDLVRRLDADHRLADDERAEVAAFIDRLRRADRVERETEYVQTFDMTPEHSLHLTHHIFGDDRGRGPALIDLSEYYKSYGLENVESELPDYLPLMLEFAAQLDAAEARVFLGDAGKVLDVLAANLDKAGSPYAPLVRIVRSYGTLTRLAA